MANGQRLSAKQRQQLKQAQRDDEHRRAAEARRVDLSWTVGCVAVA